MACIATVPQKSGFQIRVKLLRLQNKAPKKYTGIYRSISGTGDNTDPQVELLCYLCKCSNDRRHSQMAGPHFFTGGGHKDDKKHRNS
jgi:hypothetical protein